MSLASLLIARTVPLAVTLNIPRSPPFLVAAATMSVHDFLGTQFTPIDKSLDSRSGRALYRLHSQNYAAWAGLIRELTKKPRHRNPAACLEQLAHLMVRIIEQRFANFHCSEHDVYSWPCAILHSKTSASVTVAFTIDVDYDDQFATRRTYLATLRQRANAVQQFDSNGVSTIYGAIISCKGFRIWSVKHDMQRGVSTPYITDAISFRADKAGHLVLEALSRIVVYDAWLSAYGYTI